MKFCDHCGKLCSRRVAVVLPNGSISDVGKDCARRFKRASRKDIVNSYLASTKEEKIKKALESQQIGYENELIKASKKAAKISHDISIEKCEGNKIIITDNMGGFRRPNWIVFPKTKDGVIGAYTTELAVIDLLKHSLSKPYNTGKFDYFLSELQSHSKIIDKINDVAKEIGVPLEAHAMIGWSDYESPRIICKDVESNSFPRYNSDPCLDASTFIGRWFLSKKKNISPASISYWAKKYPYTGKAFRFGMKDEKGEILGSWSRSIVGLQAWKMHKFPPLGYGPKTMSNYIGHIDKGIDLVAMIIGEGLADQYRDTIIAVDEVSPIIPMTNVEKI